VPNGKKLQSDEQRKQQPIGLVTGTKSFIFNGLRPMIAD
jgi:hypothetical protein